MSDVSVTRLEDGRIALVSPFHPDMSPRAREIGGRWDAAGRRWTFDGRDEERVRQLARGVYGTDGSPADEAQLVTVRIPVTDLRAPKGGRAEMYFCGRLVASRAGRDEAVRLGPGVILISGGFASRAGSVTYPELGPREGTVVEVRGVARSAVADEPDAEIVEESVDVAALLSERKKLLARVEEINALVAAHRPAQD